LDVRRVRTDEWETLRRLRLTSLADTPTAFGATYAVSAARDDAWWIDWAERSAESETQAMMIAWNGDEPVGLAGVFEDDGRWQVVAMWVDPTQRGRGAGRQLLDAAVAFAHDRDAEYVFLGVVDGNLAARALYERYGFVDTGESEPLASHPELLIRYLRL
jgi:ribosomal protein S18 acetylase RimI-like enzyme